MMVPVIGRLSRETPHHHFGLSCSDKLVRGVKFFNIRLKTNAYSYNTILSGGWVRFGILVIGIRANP